MRGAPSLLFSVTLACNAIVNFGELRSVPLTGNECAPTKPFGKPTLLATLHGASTLESSPTLTDDELTIMFARTVGIDSAILIATRKSIADEFEPPVEVKELGSSKRSIAPTLTGDGLQLFYVEQKLGMLGSAVTIESAQIMTVRRSTLAAAFGAVQPYRSETPDATSPDVDPFVTRDGSELYFSRGFLRGGAAQYQIHRSVLGVDGTFQTPAPISELATSTTSEAGIAMSSDGLTIYFTRVTEPDSPSAVFTAQRVNRSAPFTDIRRVDELSSSESERPGWLSVDGCRLYLTRNNDLGTALYVSTRPPK